MRFRTGQQRINVLFRWSRYFFFTIAILALTYCGLVLLDMKLYQASQTRLFEQALKDSRPVADASENLNSSPLPPASDYADRARAQIGSSGSDESPLGRIDISRLDLAVMILEGTDERTLQRGVGHIAGTPLPGQHGNVAIAGHRDTFFRALREIRIDDEIKLTTWNGSYRYRVVFTKVVAPEETGVLARSDDAILTLVTCYPFYFVGHAPERFIVRAHWITE